MTVLQAIVQQLYNDQSSLLMVLNNKDFTIDDLQERDSHLQYQSNFFKKAFGTEEDCNNLLHVLEVNNVSKSNDDAEQALMIDESQGDSDEESGSEGFEDPETDETDDINKTIRINSRSRNNKRPLASTNKSSDNDENLSSTKRSKSDDDDGTYAYLRGRVATLTAENKKLKDKFIEIETSWMRKLTQFICAFENLLFIVLNLYITFQ
ncbi:unnamed protein product [Adineta steineri]|uniref:Uncharacterized protein n=1 Tax=Adineta steineri TaxID=433720 RepID=A0A813YA31_9BILA|nr:unnamed protein product [Adineta steineri]